MDESEKAEDSERILTTEDQQTYGERVEYERGMVKYFNKDGDDYLKYRRGARGKIGNSNEDIFMFSGQTFIFSLILIILWITKLILVATKKTNHLVSKIVIFAFRTLFSISIFDIQFFAISEVAIVDISKKFNGKITFSYLFSLTVLTMLTYEFVNILTLFIAISKKRFKKTTKSIETMNINYDD